MCRVHQEDLRVQAAMHYEVLQRVDTTVEAKFPSVRLLRVRKKSAGCDFVGYHPRVGEKRPSKPRENFGPRTKTAEILVPISRPASLRRLLPIRARRQAQKAEKFGGALQAQRLQRARAGP